MDKNKDIEYIHKANQRFIEFRQYAFTSCKQMTCLDYNAMNLFRLKNYIREKRWSSITEMKNSFSGRTGDWLRVYECENANKLKYVVAVYDPIELWENPYTLIVELI